ncbi:hypothetical protein IA539_21645 [Gordonia sp. zg691]|uniref:DUF2599 domain-containing protein n=1 Tax=Gordonia jinghuaiqii TaxID=2758710 RepID=A0A7D7R5P1_9ACTN|nr:hypothetical protein [Gordonia jinghuaiqii]QMT03807.1 hypothetical protein H1R19_08835 [Gordonia jinghuaiqii]
MLAALIAGAGLAACAAPEAAEPAARAPALEDAHTPPGFDTTFRWTATGVLDPHSAEGTFVRAFAESFELANAGRSADWGYPGFADAAPSNIDQMVTAYPAEASSVRRQVGTAFYRGLRRTDEGEWTRIVLCRDGYRSIERDGEWTVGFDMPRPVEIDIRRAGDQPATGPLGGRRAPESDVFGGWFAPRYDFAALYPTPTADQKDCAATRPAGIPHWLPMASDDPWPTMPPAPGWSMYPGVG